MRGGDLTHKECRPLVIVGGTSGGGSGGGGGGLAGMAGIFPTSTSAHVPVHVSRVTSPDGDSGMPEPEDEDDDDHEAGAGAGL